MRRPEIVGEAQAVVERRVAIQPEDNEFGRIRIVQIFFAENLERMGGDFVGVGNDSLDESEAVGVGGMFDAAAEGVADRFAEEVHHTEN